MKIRMPKTIVASCTPVFDFTCRDAHWPKAAEPPALFISDTIELRITRKMSMPAFHGFERHWIRPYPLATSPSPMVWSVRWMRKPSNPELDEKLYSAAPIMMPMKRDE